LPVTARITDSLIVVEMIIAALYIPFGAFLNMKEITLRFTSDCVAAASEDVGIRSLTEIHLPKNEIL